MFKQYPKLKIILIIVGAYFLTTIASKNVFVANTPVLNRIFLSNLKSLPNGFVASLSRKSEKTNASDIKKFEALPVTALIPVAKGVYAAEESGTIVYIRVTNNVEYEEKVITYQGKQITVRFPKGTIK